MFHRPLGCTAAAVLPKQDSETQPSIRGDGSPCTQRKWINSSIFIFSRRERKMENRRECELVGVAVSRERSRPAAHNDRELWHHGIIFIQLGSSLTPHSIDRKEEQKYFATICMWTRGETIPKESRYTIPVLGEFNLATRIDGSIPEELRFTIPVFGELCH